MDAGDRRRAVMLMRKARDSLFTFIGSDGWMAEFPAVRFEATEAIYHLKDAVEALQETTCRKCGGELTGEEIEIAQRHNIVCHKCSQHPSKDDRLEGCNHDYSDRAPIKGKDGLPPGPPTAKGDE